MEQWQWLRHSLTQNGFQAAAGGFLCTFEETAPHGPYIPEQA